MREEALGKDHPDVAGSLGGLGLLYYSQGKYDEAEPLYEPIWEKALGTTPMWRLDSLADLYRLKASMKAEPLYSP